MFNQWYIFCMAKKPRFYNSSEVKPLVKISMRQAKLGDLFYCVEYDSNHGKDYACFEKLESCIDFIKSNF